MMGKLRLIGMDRILIEPSALQGFTSPYLYQDNQESQEARRIAKYRSAVPFSNQVRNVISLIFSGI
jgi:hypothetical protein